MADIVVVGAGMGVLAAAARLSMIGHSVTVVEQSATSGGKVSSFQRDGFTFDTGPSLLLLPAVYRDLFLKTAVRQRHASLEDNVGLIGLDPAFGYRWADGTNATLPGSNTNRVAAALGEALGGSTEREWQRFSQRAAAMWAATRVPFLESSISGPVQLVKQLSRLSDVRTIAPWASLRRLSAQFLTDPRLRMFADRYATYTGSDPRRAPAAQAVIPFIEQTFGSWHIEGGIARLSDALHQRCLECGVRFTFNAEVTKIIVESGRVGGVELVDGQPILANIVVSDADAHQLYRDLLHDSRASSALRRLERATPSMSGFVMLLALRGRTAAIQHHNVLFSADYDAEFDAIFGNQPRPVTDPTLYICAPSDPTMRPDRHHESWYVLANAPRHDPAQGVDWRAPGAADRYADHLLTVMASRGLAVQDRLLWREVRTPAWLQDQTRSPGGSIYGTSSHGAGGAFLRPANRSPIPGLFLVGGSAHPGGGLPLVGMSAAIVSDLIGPA